MLSLMGYRFNKMSPGNGNQNKGESLVVVLYKMEYAHEISGKILLVL